MYSFQINLLLDAFAIMEYSISLISKIHTIFSELRLNFLCEWIFMLNKN